MAAARHHGGPSIWLRGFDRPAYPAVKAGQVYDVAIIGAGIVGITLAHKLIGSGLRIAIFEGGEALGGITGYTTGKLTSQHGLIYQRLLKSLGAEGARAYYDANQWALNETRDLAAANQIECDMTRANAAVVIGGDNAEQMLNQEVEALTDLEIPHEVLLGEDARHGGSCQIIFPDQAHFHPLKFLSHLLRECAAAGVQIFENSRVERVNEEDDGCEFEVNGGRVKAKQVVVATGYPIHDSGLFITKLAPYRSYAMAVRLAEPVPPGMYITEGQESMTSTRPALWNGEPVLIAGGEHHKVGQEPETPYRYAELEGWVRTKFEVEEVLARWSTQDNWTPDHRAYIGKSPGQKRIFVATGFGGWGMTTGRLAAEILAHQLREEEHRWESLFSPERLTLEMVPEMASENINVAKRMVKDILKPGDVAAASQVQPGQALILSTEEGRVAVYREEQGRLHSVSAICTHMGCQVAWNEAERSWDCPCHGSRFSPDGCVLQGPATIPLEHKPVE